MIDSNIETVQNFIIMALMYKLKLNEISLSQSEIQEAENHFWPSGDSIELEYEVNAITKAIVVKILPEPTA